MSKKVAIIQSNYIPWKGYFDLIRRVDELILYDDVQYTRNDWRNRNRIKTPQGAQWLTIPIQLKGHFGQAINETMTKGLQWRARHWKTLKQNYSKAPHFSWFAEQCEALYLQDDDERLSQINFKFISMICRALGITTKISWSTDYPKTAGKTERLVNLCRSAGASLYLSGPSAKDYLDESLFRSAGISVAYMSYEHYPEYPQLYGPFEHRVSVVDLLFNEGPNAIHFMTGTA